MINSFSSSLLDRTQPKMTKKPVKMKKMLKMKNMISTHHLCPHPLALFELALLCPAIKLLVRKDMPTVSRVWWIHIIRSFLACVVLLTKKQLWSVVLFCV